ncbi:dihydrolipoamide acetyltransferase family protein [Roseibium sp.]|uniref:dihydrolipoamide acetyltransferase family protein n=1 Tax=Roseibium sp. TaxID=1936156 RepID=UPI003A98753B
MGAFYMPSLGADMEAGKLVEWLVQPGDMVRHGDVIAVVETQKGAIEIEVFEDGVFEQPLVDLGATVPVGTPIAVISGEGGEDLPPSTPPEVAPAVVERPEGYFEAAEAAIRPVPAMPGAARKRISPAARRLASKHDIDASALAGTGPEGTVVYADVEAVIGEKTEEATPKPAGFDFGQMRTAIGAAMARSKREIPHYYLQDTVDVSAANDWLSKVNADRSPADRLLLGALFVKATALAAKKFPEFSGFYGKGGFDPAERVHVGAAIAVRGGGLVAPAIHDTAELSLGALMKKMRDLVGRVRAGRFKSSEIADPTITVSSLGERGVESLIGVIYPPQVAIVGFGKPGLRPWVVDDQIVPRLLVATTLAADHRVSDGHRGALFLAEISKLLQKPEAL